MFATIVIGYDGSTQSADALALARALAGEDSRLVVACVQLAPLVPARLVQAVALEVTPPPS
jgi:nucleotide-binding universal stress UspA family protein